MVRVTVGAVGVGVGVCMGEPYPDVVTVGGLTG
jgi:hypothetical protein